MSDAAIDTELLGVLLRLGGPSEAGSHLRGIRDLWVGLATPVIDGGGHEGSRSRAWCAGRMHAV